MRIVSTYVYYFSQITNQVIRPYEKLFSGLLFYIFGIVSFNKKPFTSTALQYNCKIDYCVIQLRRKKNTKFRHTQKNPTQNISTNGNSHSPSQWMVELPHVFAKNFGSQQTSKYTALLQLHTQAFCCKRYREGYEIMDFILRNN